MRIVAMPQFRHPGNLKGFALPDPRGSRYEESNVEIDLRECEFIGPSAMLWCIVYSLLARLRGSDCTLLVPENMGLRIHLKSLGMFRLLQEKGIEVDDLGVPERDAVRLIIPLTEFETEYDVEQAANDADLGLMSSGLGAANMHYVVTNAFSEFALNAVQHSESKIGSFGYLQYYESSKGPRLICAVADGGVGIRRSLERNPRLRSRVPYDWVAIEVAMQERVSGTQEPTRGMGLFGVAEEVRKAQRQLVIQSGIGSLHIEEDLQSQSRRTKLFPGTLTYASIPC